MNDVIIVSLSDAGSVFPVAPILIFSSDWVYFEIVFDVTDYVFKTDSNLQG